MSELRFALRVFLRDPRFAAVALLPLALGIGVNAAVIGLVDALLLRPMPGITASRLVWISAVERGAVGRTGLAFQDIEDLRSGTAVFEEVAGFRGVFLNLSEGSAPERIPGQVVTGNFFQALGVRPAAGRWFLPQEGTPSASEAVAVVSYGFWQGRLGGQASALGRRLTLNGSDFTIVGVAPARFVGVTMADRPPEVWIPAPAAAAAFHEEELLTSRQAAVFEALGRLRPDVSAAAAAGPLRQAAARAA
ncbi:MAG TPA: ABC transporter permease, partial [Vicinamibacterales bacterium]|nr:ABC transporter permease [Vicinamibacterales bacterium]